MFRRILAAVLACAVSGTVSLTACADSESTAEAGGQEIEYIYSDIAEKQVNGNALYEEILAKQIVFYSNISNGAVIGYSVDLDLPDTITVLMEKDGEKIEYDHGETIEEPGKYSLTMMVSGEDLLGGKPNEIYYGLFRFWIADIPVESVSEYGSYEAPYTEESYDGDYESSESTVSSESPADDPGSVEAVPDSPADGSDSSAPTDGGDADQSEPGGEETEFILPETDSAVGLSQYAESQGIRAFTDNGTEFYSSVPAGTAAAAPVRLDITADAEFLLLKNGEEQTGFDFGRAVTEKGEYKLLVTDSESGEPAEFCFTIIGENVRELTKYTVPDGCVIEKAAHGKIEIRANGNSADLGSEGEYSFDISCGAYEFTESFTLDNTPPEFTVNGLDQNGKSYGGNVFIELVSDDVDGYTIMLDGKPARNSLSLSDAGKYTVVVYDRAGNSSAQSFEIIYQMDGMAVVSIILVGALVIAGVVFFIITRKKFTIR